MGVTYKLRPEVKDFIIEQKKANPSLSCRSLATLVGQKFQFHISKSSINAIFKDTGLSMPVGRRSKTKKPKFKQVVSEPAPEPKLLTLQEPPAPAVEQQEEIKPVEAFQELAARIILQKPAQISIPEEGNPSFVEFQTMKEPELPEPPARIIEEEKPCAPLQPITNESLPPPVPAEQAPISAPPEPIKPPPAEKPVEEKIEKQKEEILQPAVSNIIPETKTEAAPQEIACTGALLFKAVDYLFGGIQGVIDKIKVRLDKPEAGLEEKVASAVYSNTFSLPEELLFLTGKVFPQGEIEGYIDSLQANVTSAWDLVRALLNALDEIRSIKVSISDGGSLFLDGQFLTVWNTNQIPHDFNNPLRNTKRSINKYFYENSPLILLAANGTETPPKDFFNFLLALNQHTKSITKLILCGNDGEELEVNSFEQPKKMNFLFGLWPHQFIQYRKVKKIGEFNPVFIPSLNKEVYAAECEIELQEPTLRQSILLRGCAVKNTSSEKMRYLVVGNAPSEELATPELLDRYLSRWPQPDYAYQDASRKIEMFAYTAGGHYVWPGAILNVDKNQPSVAVRRLFDNYVKTIDFYIRRTLLPNGYQDKAFSFMREQFYSLPVKIRLYKNYATVLFYPPPGYRLRADLVYLCRKLNEREIIFPDTKRLLFSL